jgi:hypothetical protein
MTDGISIMGSYQRELYFLFSIMGILQQGTIILSNTDDYKRKKSMHRGLPHPLHTHFCEINFINIKGFATVGRASLQLQVRAVKTPIKT